MKLILIAAGGALGSLARYGIDLWVSGLSANRFPWGTLTVNGIGSFFMALFIALADERGHLSGEVRLGLTVGLLGGFTTYSAFNQQTLGYLRERAWGSGLAYAGATLAGCWAAGLLGWAAGRALAGR